MENGVKTVDEMHVNGAVPHISLDDKEENEIFEEAMETPREAFLTPHHRDPRDCIFRSLDDFGDENQEPGLEVTELDGFVHEKEEVRSEVGKFGDENKEPSSEVGSVEAHVDSEETAVAPVSDLSIDEQHVALSEKLDELPDVQASGQIIGSHEAVDAELVDALGSEKTGEPDSYPEAAAEVIGYPEAGSEVIGQARGDVEGDHSVAVVANDGGGDIEGDHSVAVVANDGGGAAVADVGGNVDECSGKFENGDVNSHGSHFSVPENGKSHEADSVEPVPVVDEVQLKPDVSVNLNGPSDEQTRELHETNNAVEAETSASAAKEDDKREMMQQVGGSPSSHNDSITREELEKKPDLVEDLSESISSNDYSDSTPSPAAPPANSQPELSSPNGHNSSSPIQAVPPADSYSLSSQPESSSSNGYSGNVPSPAVLPTNSHPESNSSNEHNGSVPSSAVLPANSHPESNSSNEHNGSVPSPAVLPANSHPELSSSDDRNGSTPSLAVPPANSHPGNSGAPTRPDGLGSSVYAGAPSLPSHPAGPTGLGFSAPAGAPSLPSRPAGLGSSAPKGAPSSPSRSAGLGSSAPTGALSLPSRPAGLGSSAPTGAPSLPSRSAGLGSLTPTGVPSLPSHPAGLGSSAPLLEPAARSLQQPRANGSHLQRPSQPSEEIVNDDAGDNDETREKLQMIRVKFLRLALRLGQTPHNVVVAQVLYRLGLAEQLSRNTNRPGVFSFDQASIMAEHLETGGHEPLDFSCTIMVIGKTGVGKSSTINSIFDEVKFRTDAFQPTTKKVQEIMGTVQGIKVRVIDTPGLFTSSSDQRSNERVLRSVKKFISKASPDIVLYIDRLDMQSRDFGDVPLLRTVTDVFGASIWFNAIVVLTHAASAPPDGPNGTPLSYEMFVTQRSHVVQQAIRQAAGDVRLMNPVSLVENHSACRMNRAGQRVLPNGQVWKPQLLLLSFASKILAEANMLLQLQDSPPGNTFGSRTRVPPLPFLLNSLLQTRIPLKLPDEQFGDEDSLDEDLDDASDSDAESDYDDLPPFKCLTRAQLEKLNKAQKKAYFEELDYREKLFFRKQMKQEKKRRKLMKKMAEAAANLPSDYSTENLEDESSGPASVPVPMPDYVLPASFDSDNPSHRYRFLDSSSSWLVRPVLDSQGWDHDVGYESLNVERLFVVKDKIPLSVSGQLTKDKKEFNLQMEAASSIKHSEGKATSLVLDMQTVGKDVAYTLRGETMFKNFRRNDTTAGLSATMLGDSVSAGVKIEDRLIVSKAFRLLMSGGAMHGRGEVAYGGRLEATLRDKDYPIGRMLSTLALSIVDWRGDMAIGCNVQSHIPLGRGTNLIGHANLSNRGSGQVGIRLNSSEHLQIALLALVPVFRNVKRVLSGSSQSA